MSNVVRLKQGSAAFHFALDMVGALNEAEAPVLPERPLPGGRVRGNARARASECKVYYMDRARASGTK